MRIEIKQWEQKLITSFQPVVSGDLSADEFLYCMQQMFYTYQKKLGTQPFNIVYTSNGYAIKANHFAGIISYRNISLFISPIIPDLTYEKLLYLESVSNSYSANQSKKHLMMKIGDEDKVSVVEYYAVSLIDNVYDILSNGVIEQYERENQSLPKIKGEIDFSKQISKSPYFNKFEVKRNNRITNIPINQLIYAALIEIKKKSSKDWIISAVTSLLIYFDELGVVLSDEIEQIPDATVLENITINRPDYENALAFSMYILFGLDFSNGSKNSTLPEHVIEMNFLFENYVTESLRRSYKQGFTKKYTTTLGVFPDVAKDSRNIELDGYYKFDNHNVIVDAKNKYKSQDDLGDKNNKVPNNADLYQQYYYAKRMSSNNVVLVYPASKTKDRPIGEFKVVRDNQEVNIISWGLNISGSPRENIKAIKNLARFIQNLDED